MLPAGEEAAEHSHLREARNARGIRSACSHIPVSSIRVSPTSKTTARTAVIVAHRDSRPPLPLDRVKVRSALPSASGPLHVARAQMRRGYTEARGPVAQRTRAADFE